MGAMGSVARCGEAAALLGLSWTGIPPDGAGGCWAAVVELGAGGADVGSVFAAAGTAAGLVAPVAGELDGAAYWGAEVTCGDAFCGAALVACHGPNWIAATTAAAATSPPSAIHTPRWLRRTSGGAGAAMYGAGGIAIGGMGPGTGRALAGTVVANPGAVPAPGTDPKALRKAVAV
jgi:hypothetical protein